MTKISAYPEIAVPTIDDLLIGTDVETQNQTKNFSIQSVIDLATIPTLQKVVDSGNTIVVPTTVEKGIDITLVNESIVYQNGISVTIPTQTGVYPTYQPAPDAFIANINGQTPGALTGSVVGFLASVAGEDNVGFLADLTATSGNSRGFEIISFDAHTGDYFKARKQISGIETIPFKVANNGDTTAKSFIKTGGISSQYLMADGSVTTGGGGGSLTVGALTSPTANGAIIASNVLQLAPASVSTPGVISTASQTFGGQKTFNDLVIFNQPITFNATAPYSSDITGNSTFFQFQSNVSYGMLFKVAQGINAIEIATSTSKCTFGAEIIAPSASIASTLRLTPLTSLPGSALEGTIVVQGSPGSRHIFCYLDSQWKQLDN